VVRNEEVAVEVDHNVTNPLDDVRRSLTRTGFRALNAVMVPAVKAGFGTPLPLGVGLIVLETTGRVSGQPREVPLVATRCGRRVNVSTVRGSSQWVKNLQARPDASIWIGGRRRDVTSHIDTGPLSVAALEVS
jgi:hypothetical protein